VLRSNWFQSKSELNYLTALIARRSVVPDFPDTSLRKEIDASEQIKVKWESVRKLDNGDVIFMASILGEKGWLDIWTRCGVAVSKGDSLEKLLQAALDEVRKEESEKTQTEGSFVLEAVSQDVVAAYAINPEAISNIRISR
jgi:hypothetical protein